MAAQVRSEVLQVVPRDRGVALATFDVTHDPVLEATVRLPDGRPLPPGIDVHSTQRARPLLSGYGGRLEIEDPRAGERFEARWRHGRCSFEIVASERSVPSPGPYTCRPAPVPGLPGR